ncbi:ABC transporter ATP-binding protein [Rhodococcoides corynebacterioides]|uniref:ABC transporter ATP-binding protein n=1 Tax=Rhodococcoides corynebacterioides TaxID=53972 RepID=A0ABS7P4A2_9NOCA|nr:ATP-binding cassette domain-containing protein [Rhodococcus corynebacterioides]MBY6367210.1 ABC transporter ATP-binding protein [Rhodococcus corynebacterioides]MBY6407376.1 ABC transporter ATP-binding protein [Rhodococcus corynebacterioides]
MTAPRSAPTLLAVRDLDLRIGPRTLVRGLDLTVRSGDVVAVTGPNGAGKSTLLRTVAGLRRSDPGAVVYGPAVTEVPGGPRNGVGYAAATLAAPGALTVTEFLHLLARLRGSVRMAPDVLGLGPCAATPIAALSTGERKKVGVAAAVQHRPALVVLDEPFEALDDDSMDLVTGEIERVRRRGGAVVLCTHRADRTADLATTVVRLGASATRRGSGTPDTPHPTDAT